MGQVRLTEVRRGDTGTFRFTPPFREQPRSGLVTTSGGATPLRGGATRQARREQVRRGQSVERSCGKASPLRQGAARRVR